MISVKKKVDYFSQEDWTGVIGLKRNEKSVFGRSDDAHRLGPASGSCFKCCLLAKAHLFGHGAVIAAFARC
jgi:hypothetical protein